MADLMARFMVALEYLRKDQRGQGMVEYALILVLVSIIAIVMLTGIGNSVNAVFEAVNTALALP
jgi:pilus assembly protein Flp/PilA